MIARKRFVVVGGIAIALAASGTGSVSAGLQNGAPNCIHNFSGAERVLSPSGARVQTFISLEIAHINGTEGKSIDGGKCVELADVPTVKGGGLVLHTAYIPFRYTKDKKLIPLTPANLSVRYGFFFVADAQNETSSTVSGSVEISKSSVGLGGSFTRTYKLLRDKRKGRTGVLSATALNESCTVVEGKADKNWFVSCRIRLPYDETTYRWPNGRSKGGLQVKALNSRMSVTYAKSRMNTSGEAIANHAPCSNWPTWPDDAADDCDGP